MEGGGVTDTKKQARKALAWLALTNGHPHDDELADRVNTLATFIHESLPAAPVKHGDVAEAVDALSRMIETAEKTLSLKEAEAKKGNDWVVATAVHSSQHIIKLKPLITASKQRPEVLTVEEFRKYSWCVRGNTSGREARETCDYIADELMTDFPHGLIIKSGEG